MNRLLDQRGEREARARAAIEAINSGDPDLLAPLLADSVEVRTGRIVHRGVSAALAWAGKEYDHLVRRYAVEEVRNGPESVLAVGSVLYVWKEGGRVADRTPIAIELAFTDGLLAALTIHDDARTALLAFRTG